VLAWVAGETGKGLGEPESGRKMGDWGEGKGTPAIKNHVIFNSRYRLSGNPIR